MGSIRDMKNFEYKGLNATLLETLVVVYQENSVSLAADRLKISQSTLSHRLDRLRDIFDDPLFVRSGRGIQPTNALQRKIPEIINITAAMQSLLTSHELDVSSFAGEFSIAASDYERSVLVFETCRDLQKQAPDLSFRFKWEQFDNSEALRSGQFDLALAPFTSPAASAEIRHETLFRDTLECFFAPGSKPPPKTLGQYLDRDHISVMLSERDQSFIDQTLNLLGYRRRIKFIVPSISEVPALLRDSDYLVTLPASMSATIMKDFDRSTPPFQLQTLNCGMFWHAATETSPKHKWVRDALIRKSQNMRRDEFGHVALGKRGTGPR